jgi:hypothetical protein
VKSKWKRDLLVQRIRDLSDARMSAFTDASGMFHGDPYTAALRKAAISALEDGNFALAERHCEEAEAETVRRRLCPSSANTKMQRDIRRLFAERVDG